jgi:hypothetical protein
MNSILFYMLPVLDFDQGTPLHLSHVITSFETLDDAISRFYATTIADYATTYTCGHYGELEHEWIFSHHEAYTPVQPHLPMIVILRYRPSTEK